MKQLRNGGKAHFYSAHIHRRCIPEITVEVWEMLTVVIATTCGVPATVAFLHHISTVVNGDGQNLPLPV